MKRFFNTDSVIVGLVAGLGSELLFCLLLAAVLQLTKLGIADHVRWFAGMYIPLILILRAYAKGRRHLTVTRTLIVVFFVTFLAFMFYLLQSHTLVLK